MNNQLTNSVTVVGTYNNLSTSLSSEAVVVAMISGLTVTKTADKMSWADGLLTYTITVENQTNTDYVNPVITDVLDGTLVEFVTDSVIINSKKAEASQYQYNADTYTLVVNLEDVKPSESTVVVFQVTKKA